ncbi:MAG: hypothetical protein ACOH1R_00400 [Luteimonas sp.]
MQRDVRALGSRVVNVFERTPGKTTTPVAVDDSADSSAASATPTIAEVAGPSRTPGTSGMSRPARVGLAMNLSYVDRGSAAYATFKTWVDSAVNGNPGYEFAASEAAMMFQLTGNQNYCTLAMTMVEAQVVAAESAIAGGGRPEVAGDSYLHVGQMISDLSVTLQVCGARVTSSQRTRWSAYAEQAVWNVWNPTKATWGGRSQTWSGWSINNPGNNYYYSFVEATMYWALASNNATWMNLLRNNKLPALQAYFAKLPGGGSREGTGYGTSHMRLFPLYRVWHDATGVDFGNANSHLTDSIYYWIHATVPTLDRFAPLGDQARVSVPDLFDYHRRLVLEARSVTHDVQAQARASWWLANISVQRMGHGFNRRYDLLPAGNGGTPPTELLYHAKGAGNLFARTDWSKTAMWVAFTAGTYNESHAHQDQGGFTLFANDWLAVTENIWSHSGIQQGTETHNVLRFEQNGNIVRQCDPSTSSMTVTPGSNGAFSAVANLTPAYCGNSAVRNWQRTLGFAGRKLTVTDRFSVGSGTTATFQINVPVQPTISGTQANAGRLHIRVLEPANATLSVQNWNTVDSAEYNKGWRIDVKGSSTGYVVELYEN